MRALAVLLLFICTACSHTQAQYGTTVSSGGGTTVAANSGAVYAQGRGPLTFVVLTTLLIATAVDTQPLQAPNWSVLSDWTARQPPPEMQLDRVIHEQDCTKPIDLTAGNLRCR